MLKKLSKDFILYGIGGSLSKLSSLLLLPFFTSYFTPEEYGILELLTVLITLFSIVCLLQLESSLSRFFYEFEEEKRGQMITTLFVFVGVLSFLVMTLLLFLSKPINLLLFDTLDYKSGYLLAVLSLPFFCWNALLIILIRFMGQTSLFIKSQFIGFLISLILPIILVVKYNQGIESFFWGQGFSLFIVVFFLMYSLRTVFSVKINVRHLLPALQYSVPLIPGIASGWINSYGSRFVMISFLSFREIGIYAAAIKIASIFQLIGSAFRMTWPQFFWKTFKEDKNHKIIFRNLHSIFSLGVTLVLLFFCFYISDGIQVFLGEEYLQATPLIPLIAFSFLIQSFLTQIIGVGPSIVQKTKYNSYAFILGTGVNLSLLFILIPRFDLFAVPICFFMGTFTTYISLWMFTEKLYPLHFSIKNGLIHSSIALAAIYCASQYENNFLVKTILCVGFSLILIFTTNEFLEIIKNKRKRK